MRKRAALVVSAVGLVGLTLGATVAEARPRPRETVTICHATRSARRPWVEVRVREGNRGHARHERDFVLTDGTCASPGTPEEPEETTTTSTTSTTQLPG